MSSDGAAVVAGVGADDDHDDDEGDCDGGARLDRPTRAT